MHLTRNVPFIPTESLRIHFSFGFVAHGMNLLTPNIRESNTLSVFRKKLFTYFFDKVYANFFVIVIMNQELSFFLN